MEEQNTELTAKLEALLFYYGEPLSTKKIAKFLGIKEAAAQTAVHDLAETYRLDEKRGLALLTRDDEVQLATKPTLHTIGEEVMKDEFREELSPAGLETLSLIAYLGPVTRPDIDYIRGVNSSFTVRNLMMRGLVDRKPHPEKTNMYIYEVSFPFLKHMGIARVEDLPEYQQYKDILRHFDLNAQPQA